MKLTILGSGTCIPYSKRGPSGYYVKLKESQLMFDCGSGSTSKLARSGINYLNIDHIFFSHLHPDHTGDLVPFIFGTKYSGLEKRQKPLNIYGGKGFDLFFKALGGAYKDWIVTEGLKVHEIGEGIKDFEDFILTSVKTPHIESSLAYKIESERKSLVYSGDTDFAESLIELAEHVDALIIECALPSDKFKMKGHLTPNEVIETARQSNPGKLIVTHLYPECDEENVVETIRENVDMEVIEARDMLEIEI